VIVDAQAADATWALEPTVPGARAATRSPRALLGSLTLLTVVGDGAVVLVCFFLAYWWRFVLPGDERSAVDPSDYAHFGVLASLATVLLLATQGLYTDRRPRTWWSRLQASLSSVSTGLMFSLSVSFVVDEPRFSRLWFAVFWLLAVGGIHLWRTITEPLTSMCRARLTSGKRVVIVGANAMGEDLARELAKTSTIAGFVDNGSDLEELNRHLLGPITQLERIVSAYLVDEIVIALPASRREQVDRIVASGFRRPVGIKVVPESSEMLPHRLQIEHVGSRTFIGFNPVAPVSLSKRLLDLTLGGLALVLASPVMLVIAAAIKLDTTGPVLYRQERVGKDGGRFVVLKFRSMAKDADQMVDALRELNEATGPMFKIRRDPRVTRVGRLLRRLSLDELPQLLNVLRGDMSLVGPRPPLVSEVAAYEDWQHLRLRARPGITGLWQVSGRSEVPFEDMIRLDVHYVRNWSFELDLEILLRTIPAVFTSRGAY